MHASSQNQGAYGSQSQMHALSVSHHAAASSDGLSDQWLLPFEEPDVPLGGFGEAPVSMGNAALEYYDDEPVYRSLGALALGGFEAEVDVVADAPVYRSLGSAGLEDGLDGGWLASMPPLVTRQCAGSLA